MNDFPRDEIVWSIGLMASLREGGVWGVPRSGLVFQKRGDALVLVGKMPYEDSDLSLPRELYDEGQEADIDGILKRFEAAGFQVLRDA